MVNKTYRHLWLPELIATLALAVLVTVTFSITEWDMQAAAFFYDASAEHPWPQENFAVWKFFYNFAPIMTGFLAAAGIAALVLGTLFERFRRWRLYGLFFVLSIVIGPGLVINAVFKDHWGRPRPRQVEQLGGEMQFQPPLIVKGESGAGKSFPCGHASVGFVYCALYFLLRRRNALAAFAVLAAAIALGFVVGVGRMAAGGHFLSDVFWAFLMCFWVCQGLYYGVLSIPRREDNPNVNELLPLSPKAKALAISGYAVLGAALVLGMALATPERANVHFGPTIKGHGRQVKGHLSINRSEVELSIDTTSPYAFLLSGTVHGFGLPTNEISQIYTYIEETSTLDFDVQIDGYFTELDSQLVLAVNPEFVEQLELVLQDCEWHAAPEDLALLEDKLKVTTVEKVK